MINQKINYYHSKNCLNIISLDTSIFFLIHKPNVIQILAPLFDMRYPYSKATAIRNTVINTIFWLQLIYISGYCLVRIFSSISSLDSLTSSNSSPFLYSPMQYYAIILFALAEWPMSSKAWVASYPPAFCTKISVPPKRRIKCIKGDDTWMPETGHIIDFLVNQQP